MQGTYRLAVVAGGNDETGFKIRFAVGKPVGISRIFLPSDDVCQRVGAHIVLPNFLDLRHEVGLLDLNHPPAVPVIVANGYPGPPVILRADHDDFLVDEGVFAVIKAVTGLQV